MRSSQAMSRVASLSRNDQSTSQAQAISGSRGGDVDSRFRLDCDRDHPAHLCLCRARGPSSSLGERDGASIAWTFAPPVDWQPVSTNPRYNVIPLLLGNSESHVDCDAHRSPAGACSRSLYVGIRARPTSRMDQAGHRAAGRHSFRRHGIFCADRAGVVASGDVWSGVPFERAERRHSSRLGGHSRSSIPLPRMP